jgi:hypothetical protein
MRYFLNTSAAKPVVAGGETFEFELVGLRGGSWLGILALDEPRASVLAAARAPNTDEISEEIYLVQKKKLSVTPSNSSERRTQSSSEPALTVADRVGSLTPPAASKAIAPNSTSITAVSLMMTSNSPPPEPLLSQAPKRRNT